MIKRWMTKLLGRTPPGGMNCHEVGEVLQQYLDGHIDAERAERIDSHLDECRRCGMEADTYERIKSTLATQRSDVPAESIDRLRQFGDRLVRGEEPTAP